MRTPDLVFQSVGLLRAYLNRGDLWGDSISIRMGYVSALSTATVSSGPPNTPAAPAPSSPSPSTHQWQNRGTFPRSEQR